MSTPQPHTAQPLWHGRFDGGPAQELWEFTLSLPFDRKLAFHDLRGCRVHAEGLGRVGLLSAEETGAVLAALTQVEAEWRAEEFVFVATDEDIHTAIERRVTELAGDAGAKLHTGRSRNDQVATAFRLWVKDAQRDVAARLLVLAEVLVERAETAGDTYLPGYTHLQQAQPVLLSHHLLAHFWALSRDLDRLLDATRRADVSPLGAGALAGSSLPIDPVGNAVALGFDRVFDNSLDAVSDRDFAVELLFVLALLGVHLSRIGEEFVLWSGDEFGFVRLDDAYATGSSMLPQKKNPDIAELARGKTGRLIGNLTGLLVTLKGLPLAYNRDLQEDKEPVFDSVETVSLGLLAVAGMIRTATFDTDRMAAAADSPYASATDLAEHLVAAGTPFRQAHAIVGALVRRALAGDGSLAELVAADAAFDDDAVGLLDRGIAVTRRTSAGGAGPGPVADQLLAARAQLGHDTARVQALAAP